MVQAAEAYGRRDLATADRNCRSVLASEPSNADAMHLLGLVLKQAGDTAAAEPLLRMSIELQPRRCEFRINLSNLLTARGRFREAEVELRTALEIEPGSRAARLALARLLNRSGAHVDAEAAARPLVERDVRDAEGWVALADAEREQGRLAAAEASFRRALAVRPDYAVARHNLGALLGRMKRAEESLAELERAAALGVRGAALDFNRARALLELSRFDDTEAALVSAVKESPEFLDAQVMLAKLRYMRGDEGYTRALTAVAKTSAQPILALTLGDLLRRGGRLVEAENVLRAVARRHSDVPQIQSSLAVVLQEQGKLAEALELACAARAARPQDADISENLIAMLLQADAADDARPLIAREQERAALDQRWLAYEAVAARLAGLPRYEMLYDYQHFVAAFDLEPPPGYATIADFNTDLAARLAERHRFRTHPLDQSLRHGTQSPRDLLFDRDPVIQAFIGALAAPLAAYRDRLGFDADHPFLRRNRGTTRLAGCWSVQLHRAGYHVNHIHPQGWISSAYYVAVPAEVEDVQSRNGWIKFGEPRMPTPRAEPAHFARPKAGRLLLFPSYMWHGTTPLAGDAPRLTLAFDAVTVEP